MTLEQAMERIEELQAEVEFWKSEAQAQTADSRLVALTDRMGLTQSQGFIVLRLLDVFPRCVQPWALAECYPGRRRTADACESRIRVLVSKIRMTVGKGIIENRHGMGYRLGAAWEPQIRAVTNA